MNDTNRPALLGGRIWALPDTTAPVNTVMICSMNTEKALLTSALLVASLCARAGLINGSFDTADLTGWTVEAEGGVYSRWADGDYSHPAEFVPYPFPPLSNPALANGFTFPSGGPDGPHYLDVYYGLNAPGPHFFWGPDGALWSFNPDTGYRITVSQTVDLYAGYTVSGFAGFGSEEYAKTFPDQMWITIGPDEVLHITVADVVTDLPVMNESGWRSWSWTSQQDRPVEIRLNSFADSEIPSHAYFDGITVSHISEGGSTLALLAASLVAMAGLQAHCNRK